MRTVSRWALASAASVPLAGVVYFLCWLVGERMVAADQGWEMAFYWSPLAFLAVDAVLVFGGLVGLIGFVVGPGATRRLQSALAALFCAGAFTAAYWR